MKNKFEALLANNKTRTILTVLVVAVLVTACIGMGTTLASRQTADAQQTITEQTAQKIALKKAGGGTIKSIAIDYEDGEQVYKTEVINGDYEYDIEINAQTSDIISYEKDRISKIKNTTTASPEKNKTESPSSNNDVIANSSASNDTTSSKNSGSSSKYISEKKAKSIALDKVSGGNLVYCYLDYDDGRAQYEVEITKGKYEYEMEIDAITGNIYDFDKELMDKYEHDYDDYDEWDD